MARDSGGLSLNAGEIHLWLAQTSEILPNADPSQLDTVEHAFLDRLKNAKARAEFLMSHCCTRVVLSRYLSTSPREIQFRRSTEGKPSLISESQITFNRSHSGGWWVLAVAQDLAIGVDIENTLKLRQCQGIVDRWFTSSEQMHFQHLPERDKRPYFYAIWTQKEAVLKAAGVGLSRLSDYVSLAGGYGFTAFSPSPNIAGCVAYQVVKGRPQPQVTFFSV